MLPKSNASTANQTLSLWLMPEMARASPFQGSGLHFFFFSIILRSKILGVNRARFRRSVWLINVAQSGCIVTPKPHKDHNIAVLHPTSNTRLAFLLLCALLSACQTETRSEPVDEKVVTRLPAPHQFANRDAWKLENNRLRVSVLQVGGHIAELVLKTSGGESVNPLWVPPWPSIDPRTYNVKTHGDRYGTNSEASLLSGIMGHNLCFDFWGPPSDTEFVAGTPYHGAVSTTLAAAWGDGNSSLSHRMNLSRSGTSIVRKMTLVSDQPVLYVEETAESLVPFDKPIGWVQHPTFGPPFVHPDTVYFDASATVGDLGPEEDYASLGKWPVGAAGEGQKDYRRFSPEAPSYKMAFFLMDSERDLQFITALSTKHNVLIGYLFWRSEYPWMMVWEENRRIQDSPWNGETVTRGMEFGNTRIPGTAKEYFKKPEIYDTPTFGWLDAQSRLTKRYMVFLTEIPASATGVNDVTLNGNEIIVEVAGIQHAIRIAYDPAFFPRPQR